MINHVVDHNVCLSLATECDWKINNTDRLGSSSAEKPRYYNSASKFRCHNCNQRGHFTHACPQPKVSFQRVSCIKISVAGYKRATAQGMFNYNSMSNITKE